MKNNWKKNNMLKEKTSLNFTRLQEGAGSGYKIGFYDIELQDVKIISKDKHTYEAINGDDYLAYTVKFKAKVVAKNYDYSCKSYYWAVNTAEPINYYGDYFENPYEHSIKVSSGVVEGVYEVDGIRKNKDITDKEIIEDITREKFDISTDYSGGWVHHPVGAEIVFEEEDEDTFIDATKFDIYNDATLHYAKLKLPQESVDSMNDCINYAMDPDELKEDSEFEEKRKRCYGVTRKKYTEKRAINRLFENKNHIIDRLSSLSDDEKEAVKAFFNKHPEQEPKIDWKNRRKLTYEDFTELMDKFESNKKNSTVRRHRHVLSY